MNDAQYNALMQEVIRGNNLLTRLVNAAEGAAVLSCGSTLKFWDEAPAAPKEIEVGDIVEMTRDSAFNGRYYKAGARGRVVAGEKTLWRVDFRGCGNFGNYHDCNRDSAFGATWYVEKRDCKLAELA